MVDLAASVWRDFVTDGVPASGPNKPLKTKIRAWGTWLEGIVTAFTSNGGLIYTSLAAMNADLAHAANSSAWVVGDATVANNGIYQKLGASGVGSWSRVADLPYSFIKASNAGAGSANALVATTAIPIPANDAATLIALNIYVNNTGAATVAFNGSAPLTIKTNNGNDVQANYLVAGAIVAGYVSGSTFRLISDVSSAADRAAAEAAAAAAAASASSINLPSPVANTFLQRNASNTAYVALPVPDTRLALAAPVYVADRTALKALDTTKDNVASLKESGREGVFKWTAGDFSTLIAADTREGVYVKANAIASTSGAWVRIYDGGLLPEWFFNIGDASYSSAVGAAFSLGYTLQKQVGLTRMYACSTQITIPGAFGSGSSKEFSLAVAGRGEGTGFYHDFDGALFNCVAVSPAVMRFVDFKVISRSAKTTAAATTFMFNNGLVKALFRTIRLGSDGTAGNEPQGLFDCGTTSTTDTIVFEDCHLEGIRGRGYGIANGSSIWFRGGRIIGRGTNPTSEVSVGVKLYGGNGGVWFSFIDIINLNIAVHVTATNGTTNREIFLNETAIDSSYIGLALEDASYVDWTGVWAASCAVANILLLGTFTGIFKGTGGTIFNGGAVTGAAGDGITINTAAQVDLTGVLIRNNAGRGVRCPATGPTKGNMTGCTIRDNNIGFDAGGTWAGTGNNIINNTTSNLTRNTANLTRFVAAESQGSGTYTTDTNGEFLVAHGLGIAPIFASAVYLGDVASEAAIVNFDATNLRIRVRNTTSNADVASASVSVMWHAVG